jgi:predicted nucleotidyltransferase
MDDRTYLLAGVLNFVRAARQREEVSRLALIGSLMTTKHNPKDADLLVTIQSDADITALATLGRRLKGYAQQRNLGGDIFLASLEGHYLGRTCPWRECRPFKRQSCDALHCGARPYLHDDLATVTLQAVLIAAPPLELWPQIVARVAVPDDVTAGLVIPLQQDQHATETMEQQ